MISEGKPIALGSEPSGARETTNIRMEGYALMAALRHAAGEPCVIYSDSEFWINVLTKWAPVWEAKGWKKSGGPIKNLDIVQELYPLYEGSRADLNWVRGHNNDPGNEMADLWANKARQGERL